MINLFNTHIETLSIHRVGNKSRNEAIFLSEQPFNLNDEIVPLIKEFFLKPFREKEENYFQFAHEVDLDYNDMFKFATQIFDNPNNLHEVSKQITQHLFEQYQSMQLSPKVRIQIVRRVAHKSLPAQAHLRKMNQYRS